jgi:hypothetical protein
MPDKRGTLSEHVALWSCNSCFGDLPLWLRAHEDVATTVYVLFHGASLLLCMLIALCKLRASLLRLEVWSRKYLAPCRHLGESDGGSLAFYFCLPSVDQV